MLGAPLLAAATAMAAGLSGAHPAQPVSTQQKLRFTMSFGVSPDQVKQGDRITLTGRAGHGETGNAAPVDILFRARETAPYQRITTRTASPAGQFSATLTATASGDYQAVYRGNTTRGTAAASDYLAVYTTRTVDRLLYRWSATNLQCQPVCRMHSPDVTLGTGPVHVWFRRDCGSTRAGGSLGFTSDPWNKHEAGDPGWRDFPDGAGPVEFDLAPTARTGHFYLTWVSTQRERGQATLCTISFTGTQKTTEITYR